MTLKLIITLEWTEPRVKFLHLKDNEDKNILTVQEMKQLWMPSVIFTNTKDSLQLDFNKGTAFGVIVVEKGILCTINLLLHVNLAQIQDLFDTKL